MILKNTRFIITGSLNYYDRKLKKSTINPNPQKGETNWRMNSVYFVIYLCVCYNKTILQQISQFLADLLV